MASVPASSHSTGQKPGTHCLRPSPTPLTHHPLNTVPAYMVLGYTHSPLKEQAWREMDREKGWGGVKGLQEGGDKSEKEVG